MASALFMAFVLRVAFLCCMNVALGENGVEITQHEMVEAVLIWWRITKNGLVFVVVCV